MASKLQCEICGGKLVGKPGGIFECENCGTEYSTEWAKAKIQEITGTVKVEGTVEVTGKVQVENGGPNAESLVKRGMMLREELSELVHKNSAEYEKREELEQAARSSFERALDVDPENGDAYWGLYLLEKSWLSPEDIRREAPYERTLEDDHSYYRRVRELAAGDTKMALESMEALWKQADQSERLPEELRTEGFYLRNGRLLRDRRGAGAVSSLNIPACVSEIGAGAFANCAQLRSVSLPEGLKRIGNRAFAGCKSLTSVTIPGSVSRIEDYAFYDCEGLKSVTISEGVRELGELAFWLCTSLEEVTIPSSVTEVGNRSFENCKSLRTVMIREGVQAIKKAFYGCTGLNSVTIPNSVKVIDEKAFEGTGYPIRQNYETQFVGIGSFAIRSRRDSCAENYAKKHGIRFEELKTEAELNEEITKLQTELANLRGLFAGKRRREIEGRLAQIEAELQKLG